MSQRRIKVTNTTFISPLQMDGPIVTPLPVSDKIVLDLVRKGYNVTEVIDGKDIKLTLENYTNPRKMLEPPKPVAPAQQQLRERQFSKNAEISLRPKPVVEPPKEEISQETPTTEEEKYFGNEVQMVDTSINMPGDGDVTETANAGILYNGRTEDAEVSEDVEPIDSEDLEENHTPEQSNHNNNNNRNRRNKHKH